MRKGWLGGGSNSGDRKVVVLVECLVWIGVLLGLLPPSGVPRCKWPSPRDLVSITAALLTALAPPSFFVLYWGRYKYTPVETLNLVKYATRYTERVEEKLNYLLYCYL